MGKYVNESLDDPQQVFIFAGTSSSYMEAVEQIKREDPEGAYYFYWVQTEKELKEMRGATSPTVILPDDWLDNPMVADYRFKLFVTTGYI